MNRIWLNSGFNYIIKASEKIAQNINSPGKIDIKDVYVDICWLNFMAKKLKDKINENIE